MWRSRRTSNNMDGVGRKFGVASNERIDHNHYLTLSGIWCLHSAFTNFLMICLTIFLYIVHTVLTSNVQPRYMRLSSALYPPEPFSRIICTSFILSLLFSRIYWSDIKLRSCKIVSADVIKPHSQVFRSYYCIIALYVPLKQVCTNGSGWDLLLLIAPKHLSTLQACQGTYSRSIMDLAVASSVFTCTWGVLRVPADHLTSSPNGISPHIIYACRNSELPYY
jgi:hypothetical protein